MITKIIKIPPERNKKLSQFSQIIGISKKDIICVLILECFDYYGIEIKNDSPTLSDELWESEKIQKFIRDYEQYEDRTEENKKIQCRNCKKEEKKTAQCKECKQEKKASMESIQFPLPKNFSEQLKELVKCIADNSGARPTQNMLYNYIIHTALKIMFKCPDRGQERISYTQYKNRKNITRRWAFRIDIPDVISETFEHFSETTGVSKGNLMRYVLFKYLRDNNFLGNYKKEFEDISVD